MKIERRTACRIATLACGVGSAGLGFGSAMIDNPPLTDVLASGYIVGSEEFFGSRASQSRLNAWAAIMAAGAAVAAAFS